MINIFIDCLDAGEDPNEYNFTRIKLNWGGAEYAPYVSFSSLTAMVGTIVMVGGAAKLLGLADALVGFISTACSAVSKLIFVCFIEAIKFFVSVANVLILLGKCNNELVDVCGPNR